ncbi:MAG: acetyl-CoA carboxylase biotin carboxyl carrier protein subunit, partial [Pseudomonadota bacterium]
MAHKKTGFDQELIRDLANILTETDLSEIEVEQDDLRIRISRNSTYQPVQVHAPVAAAPAPVAAASAPVSTPTSDTKPAGNVTSPMVGTAYLAPAPGEAPYVAIGDKVSEGDTVLIVEAMKTMNQIPAP